MARAYTMRGVLAAAERAVQLARACLTSRHPGSRLHDVQGDPRFQHRGVDLLWEVEGRVLGVEVKGDRRQARRGTYFLELISNLERQTPGCFLYSEADILVYVFLTLGEVHHLPLPATRAWFLPQARSFPVKHTHTRIGDERYTTLGAVVPVERILTEVEGALRFKQEGESFPTLPAPLPRAG